MTTRITLSTTQYDILEHAIDHNDGQIHWFPDNVKGGARHKVIQGLLNKALITRDDNANCCVTAEGYVALGRDMPASAALHPNPEADANVDIRDYVLISLLTGARKSNVHSMRWQDINLERAEWSLPGVFTKNGDPITIPLVPEAVEIIKRRKPEKAAVYVFPGTGKSGHIENSRSGWDRVLDRDEVIQLADRIKVAGGQFEYNFDDPENPAFAHLGVLLKLARLKAADMQIDTNGARMADLRPHDLRRTLGSWQASTGSSLLMIGKTLGHRSHAATAIYAHLNIDPVRQAMATATSALLGAGKAKPTGQVIGLKTKTA